MPKKVIKISESVLKNVVTESISQYLLENNFKNPYGKMWAVAHAQAKKTGRDAKEIYDELVERFNSRTAALHDINQDIAKRRNAELPSDWAGFDNWHNWDNREDGFYQAVSPELFDQDDTDNGIFGNNLDNFDSGKFIDDTYDDLYMRNK